MKDFKDFSLSSKDLIEILVAVGSELDKWKPSWLSAGLDTWVQVDVEPNNKRSLDVNIYVDAGRLNVTVYPVEKLPEGYLKTNTQVWINLISYKINEPAPPFHYCTYYGSDGTPVAHIETDALPEDRKGPICRVYLNDGDALWANPDLEAQDD